MQAFTIDKVGSDIKVTIDGGVPVLYPRTAFSQKGFEPSSNTFYLFIQPAGLPLVILRGPISRVTVGGTIYITQDDLFGALASVFPDEGSDSAKTLKYAFIDLSNGDDYNIPDDVDVVSVYFSPGSLSTAQIILPTITSDNLGRCITIKRYDGGTVQAEIIAGGFDTIQNSDAGEYTTSIALGTFPNFDAVQTLIAVTGGIVDGNRWEIISF